MVRKDFLPYAGLALAWRRTLLNNRPKRATRGIIAVVALLAAGLAEAQQASSEHEGALPGFRTPSDNIHCMLDNLEATAIKVRCDIREIDRTPPRPSACEGDYGHAFAVTVDGQQGERWCVGDTTYDPSHPVLEYGQVWQRKGFTCRSEQTGLRCFNSKQHGFILSRSVQKVF